MICSTLNLWKCRKKKQPLIESNDMNPINPYAVQNVFRTYWHKLLFAVKYDIVITRMFTYEAKTNLFETLQNK